MHFSVHCEILWCKTVLFHLFVRLFLLPFYMMEMDLDLPNSMFVKYHRKIMLLIHLEKYFQIFWG